MDAIGSHFSPFPPPQGPPICPFLSSGFRGTLPSSSAASFFLCATRLKKSVRVEFENPVRRKGDVCRKRHPAGGICALVRCGEILRIRKTLPDGPKPRPERPDRIIIRPYNALQGGPGPRSTQPIIHTTRQHAAATTLCGAAVLSLVGVFFFFLDILSSLFSVFC